MRVDSRRGGFTTNATPRASGFKRMLQSNKFSGRLSGKGADKGIGHSADVLLGLWSCCRNVDPNMQGCVTKTVHTRTLLKCRQCGTFFDHMDNISAKLRSSPNCSYHPKEPQSSRSLGSCPASVRGAGKPGIPMMWRMLLFYRCSSRQRGVAMLWHCWVREQQVSFSLSWPSAHI